VSIQSPIAVIDDDESFRTAPIESLCSFGYDVRGFASAEDFVAAGEPGSYGCLITDVHMPGMSGIELKRLLVARDCLVPVIMITARAASGIETKAAASGAVCLLTKPFETGALIHSLESALRA
jgi:FixJ family two-component response regulator